MIDNDFDIVEIMTLAPMIAVLVLGDAAQAQPIARALVAGGIRALEVTLRTPAALEVIAEMSKVEGAVVGAGTVINEAQVTSAIESGAKFIVSPGLTDTVARPALAAGIPFLPGVSTAGDIMRGLDLGLSEFKFFPAVAAGGLPTLSAVAAPFPQCGFCPTGGITAVTALDWLKHPSVLCVGGSWLISGSAFDLDEVTTRAKQASGLRSD